MAFIKKEKFIPDAKFFQKVADYLELEIEIDKEIVKSGQRAVYLCNNKKEQLVLKVSEHFPTSISRIKREIKILTEIDSSYFPKIKHEYFVTEHELQYFGEHIQEDDPELSNKITSKEVSPFFITIENYIPHREWDQELIKNFQSLENLTSLVVHIFKGLNILWEKNIVHRDIKPQNILIKEDGVPVIIDLGIAKSLNHGTEQLTPMLFASPHTPHFASPEQLNNDRDGISYKSDQFSVGVILYFILANEFPFGDFEREDKVLILKKMLENKIRPIANVPDEVNDFLGRLLKYHPYERYRTYEDITEAIQKIKEQIK